MKPKHFTLVHLASGLPCECPVVGDDLADLMDSVDFRAFDWHKQSAFIVDNTNGRIERTLSIDESEGLLWFDADGDAVE
jgi:hypothetical protein